MGFSPHPLNLLWQLYLPLVYAKTHFLIRLTSDILAIPIDPVFKMDSEPHFSLLPCCQTVPGCIPWNLAVFLHQLSEFLILQTATNRAASGIPLKEELDSATFLFAPCRAFALSLAEDSTVSASLCCSCSVCCDDPGPSL